ncbi:MAG: hypothetical protein GY849_07850 [Deltaproteobacteria bacterium]|nr:hypothetical protein [Deltaproteobacteria bacterium]
MVLFFGLILIVDLKSLPKIGCFLLFVISGITYYIIRKKYLKSRGIDLNDMKKKEDWNE